MTSSTVSDSVPDSSVVVLERSDHDGQASEATTEHPEHPEHAEGGSPSSADFAAASSSSTRRPSRTMSILALSLGIASFFFAQSVVVPLAAILLGVFGLRDEPTGRAFSIWGIVLACVASFGWIVILAGIALFALPIILFAGF
ncbi:DUF4190 domain-containing protein [Salinibacterium sp. M195]|uniref:DUF4190 domain-containing protein n=1 Tax=Salinibacterium sp. M195 TaxID=2583374 RepID=UPI001C62C21A|nr:DUF4190 domain-containing protein [Salinibacterium sp. M195]QYH35938.1 DUF4190 domain-containing protein [Salinibacterium sp. M195]